MVEQNRKDRIDSVSSNGIYCVSHYSVTGNLVNPEHGLNCWVSSSQKKIFTNSLPFMPDGMNGLQLELLANAMEPTF